MRYRVDPAIFEMFPEFYRGVVILSGADNSAQTIPALEHELRSRISGIENDTALDLNHPRIKAWQDAYKKIAGAQGGKHLPSIGALVKRIKQGKGAQIPFISPLVAISNLISLTHLVPSGGIDASKVTGELTLGMANGGESFTPLGQPESTPIQPGEIIYFDSDSKNVMCRMWNSRAGLATILSASTTQAVIDVDGLLTVIRRDEIESATEYLAEQAGRYCGANTTCRYLSRENPEFDLQIN